jgi:hypothetical protein
LSDEHEQKRRPVDSQMDHMTHKDNGQAYDPHVGHKTSDIQAPHDRHAGYSVALLSLRHTRCGREKRTHFCHDKGDQQCCYR